VARNALGFLSFYFRDLLMYEWRLTRKSLPPIIMPLLRHYWQEKTAFSPTRKVGGDNYCVPKLLIIDEIGYVPVDVHGAHLLFQLISRRYERGSIIL